MSGFIPRVSRRQQILLPETLDGYIAEDDPVRFIDAFVDSLDLTALAFTHADPPETGRPPYRASDLLKLYLYGYLNHIRSSRRLERESHRNLEVIWLLRRLTPDFKTIADFRRDNVDRFRPLFQQLVTFCRELRLLEGDLVAIDGSKFQAVNSKDRNFNRAKLRDRMKGAEEKIDRYLRELDENDAKEAGEVQFPSRVPNLKEKIARMKEKLKEQQNHLARLEATGEAEISLTDPDSRLMMGNERLIVGYNGQIAVEANSKLVVAYDVDNKASDHHQLAAMARRAQQALGTKRLKVVADRGYFDGEQVRRCLEVGITPYVPEPEKGKGAGERTGISPAFYRDQFIYDASTDTYACPAGHRMTPLPAYQSRWRQRPEGIAVQVYRTDRCHTCPHFMTDCTHNRSGRRIQRRENEEILLAMRERLRGQGGRSMLDLRKATAEHPFGTIKRAFNQGYLLLRGLRKVTGEMGLTMLAYDLRRVITMVGTRRLLRHLTPTESRRGLTA